MRTAFYSLLFINLIFAAWAKWIDVPERGTSTDTLSRLPRLQLVTESRPTGRPTTPRSSARKMALESPGAPPRCLTVGPFDEMSNAASAAAILQDKGFDPRQRAEQGQFVGGYWVYIAGLANEADATRVLQTLARNGMKDARVMPETGEGDGRRVSVGLFSERDRADRRAKAVRKLGLNAEIAERKLPGTVYWVDVTLQPGVEAVPVQDLLAGPGQAQVGVQACPSGGAQPPGTPPSNAEPLEKVPGANMPATTVAEALRTPVPARP